MVKRLLLAVLLCAALGFTARAANAGDVSLPETIRSMLNQEYPGWKLAPVNSEVEKAFSLNKIAHPASVVWADFNGDGQKDYAIQIVYIQPELEEQIVIAYLRQGQGFEEIILQSQGVDPSLYLSTEKKSITEYNANGQPKPTQKNVIIAKGSVIGDTTYVYQNGEFHELKNDSDNLPEKTDNDIPNPS